VDLLVVRDRAVTETGIGAVGREEVGVVAPHGAERVRLRGAESQRVGRVVEPVLLEVLDRARARPVGVGSPVRALHLERGAVEVVRRVVRPEVRAVAEDRALLHEPVAQEEVLALRDVGPREDLGASLVDDRLGDGGLLRVRSVGEQAKDEEAEEEHEHRRLHPPLRDEERSALERLRSRGQCKRGLPATAGTLRSAPPVCNRRNYRDRYRGGCRCAPAGPRRSFSSMSLDGLTPRERDVLRLLALGHTNREVGELLCISVRTAETHRASIRGKLRLRTRADLVRYARAVRLIDGAESPPSS
jgi:DNA-binding CsgD family transcriptional regulator